MATLETVLEKKLVDWAKTQGGIALKGATQFDTGYPDRIIYVPDAHAHVEVKGTSSTYHLNEKQKVWAGRIIASKSPYYIIESERQLERFKEDVFHNASALLINTYSLNGDQLYIHVNPTSGTYEVFSTKDGKETRLISSFMAGSLADTIYRVFVALEKSFPKTNYEDI